MHQSDATERSQYRHHRVLHRYGFGRDLPSFSHDAPSPARRRPWANVPGPASHRTAALMALTVSHSPVLRKQ
jgi:hypothetical protein